MDSPLQSTVARLSLKSYRRLLALYPKQYRRDYGQPMEQLFRDQCRDAVWAERTWGLIKLWLRVLPDLVKTSLLEHLKTLKGRKSMTDKISEVTGPGPAPMKIFLRVAVPVFLLVFGLTTVLTFLMPESYASTARIKVERNVTDIDAVTGNRMNLGYDPFFIQTEFEVIQSERILSRVVDMLNLNMVWGAKYAGGNKLKTAEAMAMLKGRMALRPIRSTSLVEIQVYSEDRDEAARIANAIAETYRESRQKEWKQAAQNSGSAAGEQLRQVEEKLASARAKTSQIEVLRELDVAMESLKALKAQVTPESVGNNQRVASSAEIMDTAQPGLRPVRPNKPLNIVLGLFCGILLALVAGAVVSGIAALAGRKSRGTGSPPASGASRPPHLPHSADGSHARSVADKIIGVLWMGIGAALGGLAVVGMFWVFISQGFFRMRPDELFIPLLGIFWGCNAIAGFFLFRGRSWARTYVIVAGIGIAAICCFTPAFPFPLALRWPVIFFGLITVGALFLPSRQGVPCAN